MFIDALLRYKRGKFTASLVTQAKCLLRDNVPLTSSEGARRRESWKPFLKASFVCQIALKPSKLR